MLTNELAKAVVELDRNKVNALVKEQLQAGIKPMAIVKNLQVGMSEVGKLFEGGEYFLSELINSGAIMKAAMAELEPYLSGEKQDHRGSIVIGTVKGDIHDLGKDIVIMLLKGTGYNVIDLGVDVPVESFITAVKEHNAPLLALSVLLTSCLDSMRDTVKAVKDAGLSVTVLIGGGIIDERATAYCGADYGSMLASDAIRVADKVFAA